jgi:hypothetical protein
MYVSPLTKNILGYILGRFSQTNLVTLSVCDKVLATLAAEEEPTKTTLEVDASSTKIGSRKVEKSEDDGKLKSPRSTVRSYVLLTYESIIRMKLFRPEFADKT